jgi:NAD(P)-dependent dehydrogenase (short-subunit alcohol dehydrogenase family)
VTSLAPFDFVGATAFVTGAGSGIGRAIAQSLAAEGCNVVVSDVDAGRASGVAEEITQAGGVAVAQRCDVTRMADLVAARDRCQSVFGRVDIVVNNVGVMVGGLPEVIPESEWQRVFDINVLGMVRSNEVFLPVLMGQRRGHIVNTASASALLNYAYDRTPYAATKAAVLNLSENLYLYLRPYGVGVTCLCPAGVITNILEQLRVIGDPVPLRRPEHDIVEPRIVAEQVVKAVADRRFLAVSVDTIHDEVRRKGADLDRYLAERESWLRAVKEDC